MKNACSVIAPGQRRSVLPGPRNAHWAAAPMTAAPSFIAAVVGVVRLCRWRVDDFGLFAAGTICVCRPADHSAGPTGYWRLEKPLRGRHVGAQSRAFGAIGITADRVSSPALPTMEPLRFDGADVPAERRVTAGSGPAFGALTAAASHNRAFPKSLSQWPEHPGSRTRSAGGWTDGPSERGRSA
jgi:hypothetical protein